MKRGVSVTLRFIDTGHILEYHFRWPKKKRRGSYAENFKRSLAWINLNRWLSQTIRKEFLED